MNAVEPDLASDSLSRENARWRKQGAPVTLEESAVTSATRKSQSSSEVCYRRVERILWDASGEH